jgi:hypothetical protein
MITRLLVAVGIGCAVMCQSVSAQPPSAEIKKTSTPPVIDGNGNDAAWADANAYGTSEFFIVEGAGAGNPVAPSPDFSIEWRALWDDNNLYLMAKMNDDVIVNGQAEFGGLDSNNGWEDDAVEFYIDAQDVDNLDYRPENVGPTEPTFQFTSVAGWTPALADGGDPNSPRLGRDPNMLPNTSITWGVNSYDGSQADRRYPQNMGQATSGPVTVNPEGGFDWTFEASFPWTALEETPADILLRDGIFGFGVAYNDDDFTLGEHPSTRENQYMWASTNNQLWNTSAAFPDVQLVEPESLPGDYNADGEVNAADYVVWRKNPSAFGGDPAGYTTWRTNFHRTAGSGSGLGQAPTPEPATILFLLLLTAPWVLRRRCC